jgi:hypothetical protein
MYACTGHTLFSVGHWQFDAHTVRQGHLVSVHDMRMSVLLAFALCLLPIGSAQVHVFSTVTAVLARSQ